MPARGERQGWRGLRRDFSARLGPGSDCSRAWGLQKPSPMASEGRLRDRPRCLRGHRHSSQGPLGPFLYPPPAGGWGKADLSYCKSNRNRAK